jgi:prepilin-type N-terminal cleavage/methylation domain-containing protein/prepilin-type processing-associated H-X9-DG protein
MARRDAFTLIELLVVIAIIALLSGLILASIGTVRNAAEAMRCSSNVRQMWIANLQYSSDYEGCMAATNASGTGNWMSALAPILDPDGGPMPELMWTGCPDWKRSPWYVHPWKNAMWKGYCRNPYLKVCLRDPSESRSDHDLGPGTGYSENWPAPLVATTARWLRFSEVRHLSERIWLGDGWDWYYAPQGGHTDANRHRGRGVYLFCDGHIERRSVADAAVGLRLNK